MKLVGGNFSSDPTFDINRLDSTETGNIFSLATKAQAAEMWETGPSASAVDWLGNKIAESYIPESEIRMTNKLTEEELKERKGRDYYAKFMTVPSDGMTDWQYDIALAETRERMIRESTMARAPDTLWQGAKNLGIALAVGVADPTNIAAAYLPTFAFAVAKGTALVETQAMKNLTKSVDNYAKALDDMSALQRAGTRAKYGSVESVPGAALVEVPMYQAAQLRGEDYDMEDVFRSIAFGLVIDTSIHVGGGALFDVATIPDRAARRALQQRINADELEAYDMVDTMVKNAQLEVDNMSALQRFQSKMSPSDRAAVAQTALAQHIKGTDVDVNGLLANIQAKMDEKLTPDQIRLDVMNEIRKRDMDAMGKGDDIPTRGQISANDARIAELNMDMDAIDAVIQGTPLTRDLIGQQRADALAQMKLSGQDRIDFIAGKKSAINKVRKKRDALIAQRAELEAQAISGTAKMAGKITTDQLAEIKAEVDKRVAASRARTPADSINEVLAGLQRTAEAPEQQRTYVEGAEGSQKASGKMQTDEAATSAIAEQLADATENANQMAEQLGVKFEPDAEVEATVKELDEMAASAKSLGLCMARTAA